MDLTQYRGGKRHDFWLKLQEVDTGKIHLAITVLEKQTDSHSSEDASNNNSTTVEVLPLVLFVYFPSLSWPFSFLVLRASAPEDIYLQRSISMRPFRNVTRHLNIVLQSVCVVS